MDVLFPALARSDHAPALSSLAEAWAMPKWPAVTSWSAAKRDVPSLAADTPMLDNIMPGASSVFSFTPPPDAATIYITINTCLQPDFTQLADRAEPPQLELSVSTEGSFKKPLPADQTESTSSVRLLEGFASLTANVSNEIYIGVTAANASVSGGTWNFQLAASASAPYHSWVNASQQLSMVDSDTEHVLLITQNLTSLLHPDQTAEVWIEEGNSLSVFVQNVNDTEINGLRNSYCGLKNLAQIPHGNSDLIAASLSSYFGADTMQQQFYVSGLNGSSTYNGYLAIPSNGSVPAVGGGGTVYAPMTFSTKRHANCAVIYGLDFCDQVAYAVPANPATYPDMTSLAALYDNTTQMWYQNFTYSLQQVACNTSSTSQYSLSKTCADCEVAYKQWLCAVSIPRCADWDPDPISASSSFLFPRNAAQQPIVATPEILPVTNMTLLDRLAFNSSRNNDTIAGMIMPGPYSEILPCEDLCYELVKSCPASLGFSCPYPNQGLALSYGVRVSMPDGGLSCSEPGSVYGANSGSSLQVQPWLVVLLSIGIMISTAW